MLVTAGVIKCYILTMLVSYKVSATSGQHGVSKNMDLWEAIQLL